MALFAVGLPLFIIYNIFQSAPPSGSETDGQIVTDIENWLSQNPREDYSLHSVQNDGTVLHINIVLASAPSDEEETQMRTLNALYDMQAVLGRDRSVSVWAGTSTGQDKLTLQGVAIFSSITESHRFKSGREISGN